MHKRTNTYSKKKRMQKQFYKFDTYGATPANVPMLFCHAHSNSTMFLRETFRHIGLFLLYPIYPWVITIIIIET